MIKALPDWSVLRFLAQHHRVIECGAGTGLWVRILREQGIDAIGIDPEPRGPDVIRADHTALGQWSDRLLLVVWPPDETDLSEWIAAWGGEVMMVTGQFERFKCPDLSKLWHYRLQTGPEGDCELRVLRTG